MPGKVYLEDLQAVGLRDARIVGFSGYKTSECTEAAYLRATKPGNMRRRSCD